MNNKLKDNLGADMFLANQFSDKIYSLLATHVDGLVSKRYTSVYEGFNKDGIIVGFLDMHTEEDCRISITWHFTDNVVGFLKRCHAEGVLDNSKMVGWAMERLERSERDKGLASSQIEMLNQCLEETEKKLDIYKELQSVCANCDLPISEDDFKVHITKGISCDYYCEECYDRGLHPDGGYTDVDAENSDVICEVCRLRLDSEGQSQSKDGTICVWCVNKYTDVKKGSRYALECYDKVTFDECSDTNVSFTDKCEYREFYLKHLDVTDTTILQNRLLQLGWILIGIRDLKTRESVDF